MKAIKILATMAVLTALPGLALAMGCSDKHGTQAQSCISGTAWDTESQTCKPIANS